MSPVFLYLACAVPVAGVAWWYGDKDDRRRLVRWFAARRPSRLAVAIAIPTVAVAIALYLHERIVHVPGGEGCYVPSCLYHPTWEDPVAILVAVAGIVVGIAVATRKPSTAATNNNNGATRNPTPPPSNNGGSENDGAQPRSAESVISSERANAKARIDKLLELARRAGTPQERAVAVAKAEQIAAKYGFTIRLGSVNGQQQWSPRGQSPAVNSQPFASAVRRPTRSGETWLAHCARCGYAVGRAHLTDWGASQDAVAHNALTHGVKNWQRPLHADGEARPK
jgi:hypothetical protein